MVALLIVGIAISAWAHFRVAHNGHHHDDHAASALSLNDGKRWTTDLPLRTGMLRIREAIEPVLRSQGEGLIEPEAAEALKAAIQENVNYLIANCQLRPQADATLHVLITDLLSGRAMLSEKPESKEGIALLASALRKYPEYFDHPGWQPLGATR